MFAASVEPRTAIAANPATASNPFTDLVFFGARVFFPALSKSRIIGLLLSAQWVDTNQSISWDQVDGVGVGVRAGVGVGVGVGTDAAAAPGLSIVSTVVLRTDWPSILTVAAVGSI